MTKTFASLSSALVLSLAMTPAAFADASAFEGFYGGLSVGTVSPDLTSTPSIDSAFGYSLFAGYNHAIDSNWVIGGELSYGMSGDHGVSGAVTEVTLDDMVTLSGRIGYTFGNTMVYGRLGYQTGDLNATTLPFALDLDGVTYGIGLEHMFTDTLSGRIEVSRSVLDVSGPLVPPGIELDTTSISIGVAFHF